MQNICLVFHPFATIELRHSQISSSYLDNLLYNIVIISSIEFIVSRAKNLVSIRLQKDLVKSVLGHVHLLSFDDFKGDKSSISTRTCVLFIIKSSLN